MQSCVVLQRVNDELNVFGNVAAEHAVAVAAAPHINSMKASRKYILCGKRTRSEADV